MCAYQTLTQVDLPPDPPSDLDPGPLQLTSGLIARVRVWVLEGAHGMQGRAFREGSMGPERALNMALQARVFRSCALGLWQQAWCDWIIHRTC
jgi:hypothetical protein